MTRSTPMQMWRSRRSSLTRRVINEMRRRPDLMGHLEEGWPELHAELRELEAHLDAQPPVDGPSY